jgi:hypothetical protein
MHTCSGGKPYIKKKLPNRSIRKVQSLHAPCQIKNTLHGETVAVLDADTGALKLFITLNDDSVGDVVHCWITLDYISRVFRQN